MSDDKDDPWEEEFFRGMDEAAKYAAALIVGFLIALLGGILWLRSL